MFEYSILNVCHILSLMSIMLTNFICIIKKTGPFSNNEFWFSLVLWSSCSVLRFSLYVYENTLELMEVSMCNRDSPWRNQTWIQILTTFWRNSNPLLQAQWQSIPLLDQLKSCHICFCLSTSSDHWPCVFFNQMQTFKNYILSSDQ